MPDLTEALRDAGCVFAEEEAAILVEAALQADTVGAEARGTTLDALAARRISGEPLEHIVGWVDFAGLRLSPHPGAFVPSTSPKLLAELHVLAVRDRRC